MGLDQIFTDMAEFSEMIDEVNRLSVSKIVQKVTIEIDEYGGEVSSAAGT